MKLFLAAALAALLLSSAAPAQPAAKPVAAGEEKISQLIVYGSDPCPKGTDDEIVVCARKPESERFRIPSNLRDSPRPGNRSWASRAEALQFLGRSGTDSCSATGAGGMTGCLNQTITEATAERGTRDSVNWNRLIEEARRERLSRIDAQAAAEEKASNPR
jgi:hypothetical protein